MTLHSLWYDAAHPIAEQLLRPLSALYGYLADRRSARLRAAAQPFSVPVVVVGNITVGGTGKTPMIQWLAAALTEQGFRVAIVSRGYGGKARQFPLSVDPKADASLAGDEATLLAQSTGCPVIVDPNRPQAVQYAIEVEHPHVVLSDDGMQHYAMHRDLEILMVDGRRGFGNQRLLPAGPMRERLSRLASVDYVCVKQAGAVPLHASLTAATQMAVLPVTLGALRQVVGQPTALTAGNVLEDQVHVVAGIGDPDAFFASMDALGYRGKCHHFADHHAFCPEDFAGFQHDSIIMTEKDWVKCKAFSSIFSQVYVVPMALAVPEAFRQRLIDQIQQLVKGTATP